MGWCEEKRKRNEKPFANEATAENTFWQLGRCVKPQAKYSWGKKLLPALGTVLLPDLHAEPSFSLEIWGFFLPRHSSACTRQWGISAVCRRTQRMSHHLLHRWLSLPPMFTGTLHGHSEVLESTQGHPICFSLKRKEWAPGWPKRWQQMVEQAQGPKRRCLWGAKERNCQAEWETMDSWPSAELFLMYYFLNEIKNKNCMHLLQELRLWNQSACFLIPAGVFWHSYSSYSSSCLERDQWATTNRSSHKMKEEPGWAISLAVFSLCCLDT